MFLIATCLTHSETSFQKPSNRILQLPLLSFQCLSILQVVVYPIVNLRRLKCGARAYVEGLEDSVIHTLTEYGLQARVSSLLSYPTQDRQALVVPASVFHTAAALPVSAERSRG